MEAIVSNQLTISRRFFFLTPLICIYLHLSAFICISLFDLFDLFYLFFLWIKKRRKVDHLKQTIYQFGLPIFFNLLSLIVSSKDKKVSSAFTFHIKSGPIKNQHDQPSWFRSVTIRFHQREWFSFYFWEHSCDFCFFLSDKKKKKPPSTLI